MKISAVFPWCDRLRLGHHDKPHPLLGPTSLCVRQTPVPRTMQRGQNTAKFWNPGVSSCPPLFINWVQPDSSWFLSSCFRFITHLVHFTGRFVTRKKNGKILLDIVLYYSRANGHFAAVNLVEYNLEIYLLVWVGAYLCTLHEPLNEFEEEEN